MVQHNFASELECAASRDSQEAAMGSRRSSPMGKRTNRIPSALKHGIYSGIGLLPTEDPTEFQEFKKQIFAELGLTGRLEEEIGEEIVCLEWRRKNLSTYAVAERARTRYESIFSV